MSELEFKIKSDEGKEKWPWIGILGSVSLALLVASFVAFPSEMLSFLKEGSKLLGERSEKSSARSQDNNANMCTGFFVMNCTAHHHGVQPPAGEPRSETQVAAPKTLEPTPMPPVVARTTPEEELKTSSRAYHNDQNRKKLEAEKAKRPPAEASVPSYRIIGPEDDLSTLGLQPKKPSTGLCPFKTYLPCYMPQGFGRETLVREREEQ